ncbi:hypothetical protein [Cellvibrio sp.]|uniref:hypothetical protein n=1 Tax=Cellvibrio sp. TaxID=1965322 RepID=UPI0039648618
MATSQHAFQSQSDLSQHFAQIHAHPRAIDLEHVSVSQLLGRDYLFINSNEVELPLSNKSFAQVLLDDLIQRLGLTEAHTVAISVEELVGGKLSFVRHDLSWHKHKICKIESTAITNAEQHEFMEMIWRCSTAAQEY